MIKCEHCEKDIADNAIRCIGCGGMQTELQEKYAALVKNNRLLTISVLALSVALFYLAYTLYF